MATKPRELDTFLPESDGNGVVKYTVRKAGVEVENGGAMIADFDPFKTRAIDHPVSDCDTLTHLLKASLGTGILAMPAAFKASGLVLGIFATIAVAAICTVCAYDLVACAHILYRRSGKNIMSFADVAEEACVRGPVWSRPFGRPLRHLVTYGIFVTYFLTCSCYAVIVAENFNAVMRVYMEPVDTRLVILVLLVPLVLLAWVPNLKYLAPVSMLANVCMGVGLGITFYYLVQDVPSIHERTLVAHYSTFPVFFGITIFAIEAIGVVMPLENNMATPQHFVGVCGVLNQGMAGVTMLYIFLGFLGYLKYGEGTLGAVTLNLPDDDGLAQTVKILIAVAVFFTFGLQFYVALDIVWGAMKARFEGGRPLLVNYALRTVLVVVCVAIAIGVPVIAPFVSLIGALCFSVLGLFVPVFVEVVTLWETGFGRGNWRVAKYAVVCVAGACALVFGTKSAIEDIVEAYMPEAAAANGTSVDPLMAALGDYVEASTRPGL